MFKLKGSSLIEITVSLVLLSICSIAAAMIVHNCYITGFNQNKLKAYAHLQTAKQNILLDKNASSSSIVNEGLTINSSIKPYRGYGDIQFCCIQILKQQKILAEDCFLKRKLK